MTLTVIASDPEAGMLGLATMTCLVGVGDVAEYMSGVVLLFGLFDELNQIKTRFCFYHLRDFPRR